VPDGGRVCPADRATPKNSAGDRSQNDYGAEPAGRPAEASFHAGASSRQQGVRRDPHRVKKGHFTRRRGIAAVAFMPSGHHFQIGTVVPIARFFYDWDHGPNFYHRSQSGPFSLFTRF